MNFYGTLKKFIFDNVDLLLASWSSLKAYSCTWNKFSTTIVAFYIFKNISCPLVIIHYKNTINIGEVESRLLAAYWTPSAMQLLLEYDSVTFCLSGVFLKILSKKWPKRHHTWNVKYHRINSHIQSVCFWCTKLSTSAN